MNQFDYSMVERERKPGATPRGVSSTAGGGLRGGDSSLSKAHIPPMVNRVEIRPANLKVWQGAGLIKVEHEGYSLPQSGGGIRGSITLFSRQSRKRLLDLLATIDRTEKPHFVTLTYPDAFTSSSRVWKNDLEKFWKRLQRRYPSASFIWKLEPQERGAPHFHLLVWGVPYLNLRTFVPVAWYETVGSGDVKHELWHRGMLGNGNKHCVELMHSWRGVMDYASKYLGKELDSPFMSQLGWDNPGRFWGIKGRDNLPEVIADQIEGLTDYQVFTLMRLMRRASKGRIKGRYYRSLTLYCENPTDWIRTLLL